MAELNNGSDGFTADQAARVGGDTTITHQEVSWDQDTRRYRRGLGGWWLGALVGVPLVLALIGSSLGGSSDDGSKAAASTATTSASVSPSSTSSSVSATTSETTSTAPAAGGIAPWTLARSGSSITVTAQVPDAATGKALIDAVTANAGGATVIDKTTVAAGVTAPAADALGTFAATGKAVPDLTAAWDGTNLTLSGTAASDTVKTALAAAAQAVVPKGTLANNLTAAAGANACSTLNSDMAAIVASQKITFATGGSALTAASVKVVDAIAAKAKACPTAKLRVAGNTDNTGTDAINNPLSAARAASVRAQLVKAGIPAASVTSVGQGSKKPIASNATEAGRAANRRVDITVQ